MSTIIIVEELEQAITAVDEVIRKITCSFLQRKIKVRNGILTCVCHTYARFKDRLPHDHAC